MNSMLISLLPVALSLFSFAYSPWAAAQLNPYSCIYEKVGDGDWHHNLYWGEKTPIAMGNDQTFIMNAMAMGQAGQEFGVICSGIFANAGKVYLFDQVASGIGLSFTKVPTCMLSGSNISATSDSLAITGTDQYLTVRKVFTTGNGPVELFYVIGIKADAGPDKTKCDQIFTSAVGVVPK